MTRSANPAEAYAGTDPYVFVSYAHDDAAEVYAEIRELQQVGWRVWSDEGIRPIRDWSEELASFISACRVFLVFISPKSVSSNHVLNEIHFALGRDKPILAIHLVPTVLPNSLEFKLGRLQAILRYEMSDERYRAALARGLPPETIGAPAPVRSAPNPPAVQPVPTSPVPPAGPAGRFRVTILYKRNLQPDERLVGLLAGEFTARGYDVFIDQQIGVGEAWVNRLERQVREADAVVVLLSAAAAQSEMLAWEVQTAADEAARRGSPKLLPVRVNYDGPLPAEMSGILDRLQYLLWKNPADDPKLVAALDVAMRTPTPPPAKGPPTGALPLTTEYYIDRPADAALGLAIARRDSIIKIKGARQVGKTSLLARGLKQARDAGARVVVTDFQKLNASELQTIEGFYTALAEWLVEQLELDVSTDAVRAGRRGPSARFERFVCDAVLKGTDRPLVWAMDEVDRLFVCPFGSEVFGLVRSWHNSRVSEPDLPWHRLTLAIAYATEAHLFISDLNQSPFNVGTGLALADFTPDQVRDLNRRYRGPFRDDEIDRFVQLVGGQPFLVNRGLHEAATRQLSLARFETEAGRDDGPFGDHLRRMVALLARDRELSAVVRGLIRGQPCPSDAGFFRLWTAGVIVGDDAGTARLRCGLYARYLETHL